MYTGIYAHIYCLQARSLSNGFVLALGPVADSKGEFLENGTAKACLHQLQISGHAIMFNQYNAIS